MNDKLSVNGRILSSENGLINRAFLFGDGFFESFRMRKGEILFIDQHKTRIRQAAKILKISLAESLLDRIENAVRDLYQSTLKDKPARGRITIFRTGTGLYAPENNEAEFVIQLSEIEKEEFVLNRQGLLVDLFETLQKPNNILSSIKTLNALPFVLAGIEKKERGLDEILILNDSNRLCEASTSNIFCVKGDQVFTPSSSEGCVNGVMRAVLLERSGEFGIPVKETVLTTMDLYECDELFISNAARGIQWIMGFRNKRYFNKMSGRLVKMLNELVQ